jgi:pimeloyl-ACP methyl ester carboxylesterase/DNA-binding winged helix-turn-helix (wHTH) protein
MGLMVYRFAGFELDVARRELRREGVVRPLQPQVFAVLEYLVRHRDRAVPKHELLERLWPDVTVTDASLQRAISLARAALDADGRRIRTSQKLGYRFVGDDVEADRVAGKEDVLVPRFAVSGGVHIAYHALGDGPVDIAIITGWVFPMRAFFDHARLKASLRAMSRMGRVILFDKRGTGLSDRVKHLPTLEQRMDDLRVVLDAVGSREAVLVGYSEGGPLSLLYATTYPERIRGLLLAGAFARWTRVSGYEPGWSPDRVTELREYIRRAWGAGRTIEAIADSEKDNPETTAWAARAEQEGASPGAALELLDMNVQIDVRPLLSAVSVPTLVLHRRDDPIIPVENARYLATHIPGARLMEVEGRDHLFGIDGGDQLLRGLEWLLGARPGGRGERFLTTILAVAFDDERDLLGPLHDIASRHGGVHVGSGPMWSFDGPERAIRCGVAMSTLMSSRQVVVRLGVHAGEASRASGGLSGEVLTTATDIARQAAAGEVRVSQVVRDLVHGSALRFGLPRRLQLDDGGSVATLAGELGEIRNR